MRSEQRKGELVQAAQAFCNTVAIKAVVCDLPRSVPGWDAVVAAGSRLRLALLDQQTASVVADGLQPVPPTALRTNEVHSEAVDVRLDLAEAGEGLSAANALEHSDGVRPAHYRPVTPVTVATIKPPRDLRTQLPTELPVLEGLSILLRKCCNAGFYSGYPELHRIALRTYRGLRTNPDGLSFNLCGVLKQRVFHLGNGHDKGVAADGAPKGVTGRTGRHRGPKMNRRTYSTDSEGGCEEFRVNDSVRQSNLALRSAVDSATRNACECNFLRFLKNRAAGHEALLAYFHRCRARYINGQELPLGRASSPNVGRVTTTGNGQRHAMERLWCLFFCHSNHHRYSQPESAIPRVATQVGGTGVVSLERMG